MKICIIAPNFLEPHAWMASAYRTALLLQGQGHDVVVLTSRTKESKSYEIINGVKVYRMPCLMMPDPVNVSLPFFQTYYLNKLIKKENPDMFIINKSMFYTSLLAIPLKIRGKKIISQVDTFPGINWFTRNWFVNVVMWVYARTISALILNISDKVVLLHEGLIPVAKKMGLKYTVIHNGVDLKKFNPKPAKDISKLKGKNKLVTYVGRLDKIKGYDILLKVVARNPKGIHFLFVCGNKHKELQAQLNKKYKNLTCIGFRDDIPAILKASDLFVLPSFSEGLPNTLMEAMAAKAPAIASNVGGIPYLVKDSAVLVQPGNVQELEKEIVALAQDKNKQSLLAKKAYEQIVNDYSWKSISKKWNKILESEK